MSKPELQRQISEDEINTFDRDGVVFLPGLFNSDWVERMQESAEHSLLNPGQLHAELADEHGDDGRFFHDTFIWTHNKNCRDFVFNSPAAEITRKLMQSNKINIFFDQWLIKEPGTSLETPWHHDMTYWPINGTQICTLWLALDEVSAETGAVEYVKGSHKWGKKYRPASFGDNSQYTENIPDVPDIESVRGDYEIAQFELSPGDCTVHHGLTVHGAPGNKSNNKRRRAYTSRWTGDDVVFHPREGLQEMPLMPDIAAGEPIDSKLWPRII